MDGGGSNDFNFDHHVADSWGAEGILHTSTSKWMNDIFLDYLRRSDITDMILHSSNNKERDDGVSDATYFKIQPPTWEATIILDPLYVICVKLDDVIAENAQLLQGYPLEIDLELIREPLPINKD